MQSVFDWFNQRQVDLSKPWVILGKGPSFSKRHQYDLNQYHTLALNHAVREQSVTLAHAIDLDVVEACAEAIEGDALALVMPWMPHVNNAPGTENLEQMLARVPLLRRLDEQGRLLWYNLSSAPSRREGSPVVAVRWFSAEAALNLLAQAGVRRVRSLGIDGGASYSKEFDDLSEKTLLANGHESFDRQFAEIAKIIARTGIDYAPLDVEAPVRVYVGSMEDQMLSVKVLEHSIRKHASMSVEVFPLHRAPIKTPWPKDPHNAPRTPFSFQRFLIPALAGHQGRAIYLDSDMQIFADIRHLWMLPFNEADLLAVTQLGDSQRRPQFSVMLLNCAALGWDINGIVETLDRGDLNYEKLMYEMAVAKTIRADISPQWNSLERYKRGQTALLHYTDMPTQPWVYYDNPLGYLWVRDLLNAIDSGFITTDEVKEHVARGYVRPSLLYQIEHNIEDGQWLPRAAHALDDLFIAPYQKMQGGTAAPPPHHRWRRWLQVRGLLRANFLATRRR